MAVPPGNHRGSDLRRTRPLRRKVRDPRTPGFRLCTKGAAPEAGSSAKQSASGASTFSSMFGGPSGLCMPPRYKAGPHRHTINDATMRLCGADDPASRHPIAAGSRSHRVSPHRAYSSERRTARSAVAAGGLCMMRASPCSCRSGSPRSRGRHRSVPPPSHSLHLRAPDRGPGRWRCRGPLF
jgi:hypothetical protein